ncbi:cation:proton antiporter [Niabella sp. CJ426]|jgi:Kef-type K+ transport system membrane component KefB|uniref:cation:proton antiporter domain-containing protein n=1 Tax=Niabella sp. CJ426 TaxID=3393740 RepID=UPI003D024468
MIALLASLDFSLPLTNPVIIFALVLFIILFAPIIFSKIKVPHIIGLIIAGVLVGPHGFNLLKRDTSIVLFGTVGLLYIMFLAGLEIDLAEFKKNRKKIFVFGVLTFLLPLICGTLAAYYILGYSFLSSLLLASMFSTHTLVAYPIASKYGVIRNRAVAMAVGGTMITDTVALLLLAAISGMAKEQVSPAFWVQLGLSSIVFVCIVLFLFPVIIRWFFKKFDDSVSQYVFVLGMVFLASFLAEAAGIEAIIGAFFSGLVLNRFVPHTSALMNRINFVGNALFIPFFLISVGMLVDVKVLVKGLGAAKVAAVIIVVALITKYVAAWATQKIFKLTATEGKMLFGLSASHAAATLAIILVGYNIITGETATGEPIRLLDEDVLNGTILLILVSCGVGSFVTEKAAKKLALQENEQVPEIEDGENKEKILISLAYAEIATDMVDLGVLLKPKKSSLPLFGLHIVDDAVEGSNAAGKGKKILEKSVSHAAASENTLTPLMRYDSSISNGIVYTIKEQQVTDIVIGLHKNADQKVFFGEVAENIIRRIYQTIYVYKPAQPFNTLKRMIVAVPPNAETEPGFIHWLQKITLLSKESGMKVGFYGTDTTLAAIQSVTQRENSNLQAAYNEFSNWDDFLIFTRELNTNDLFIIISSRKGYNSYLPQFNKLPYYLTNYFGKLSYIILYPEQLETGINMSDIQQADGKLIETLSEQIGAINKAGKYLKKLWKK